MERAFFNDMTELQLWQANDDKPEWLAWRNTLHIDLPLPTGSKNSAEAYRMAFVWLRSQLLSTCSVTAMVFISRDAGAVDPETPSGWFHVSRNWRNTGDTASQGDEKWRYALYWQKTPRVGRVSQLRIHGALPMSAVNRTKKGALVLLDYAARRANWENIRGGMGDGCLDHLMVASGVGQFGAPFDFAPAASFGIGGATDIHAATRWRRRVVGDGVSLFDAMFRQLRAVAGVYEEWRDYRELGIPIMPGHIWHDAISAINGWEVLKSRFASFLQDHETESEEKNLGIYLRFGPTIGKCKQKLTHLSGIWQSELPDLMKIYKTFHDAAGDEYVTNESIQPYIDFIEEGISKLTFLTQVDYFNPYLYPNMISEENLQRKSDLIELNL